MDYRNDLPDYAKIGHSNPADYSEKTRILGSQLRADLADARAMAKEKAIARNMKGFVPVSARSFN